MEKKAISGIMLTLLAISVLTLAFNIQPAKAEPRTWYVNDDGGSDFTRIQDAINAASPGDTIYVYNGIYFENLVVRKDSLTIIGESKSNTVIDGGGNVVISIYNNKVSVSRFTVRNGGWSWYIIWGSDIVLDYAQYCNVSDNILSNSRRGIGSYRGRHNNISGNTIFDTNQGVTLYYTLNETVTDNVISDGVQYDSDPPYGVQLWGGYDNRVMGNAITEISFRGISLGEYARNNFIQGNTMSNIGDIGIFLSYHNNTVVSNTITDSNCGIYLMEGSYDNTIEANTISNSTPGWASYGMNVYGFNNMIVDNTVTNISYTGIRLNSYAPYPTKCKNNTVVGNTVSKTNQGIAAGFEAPSNNIIGNNASDNYIGLFIFDHSDNNTFTDNDVANNYYGIVLFSSDDTQVYHNNFIDNTQQVLLWDSFNTVWDDGYPSGGNYWSDYTDTDLLSGPDQDELGSDGIWDHPYVIDFENRDRYPFTEPWAPTITATIDVDPNALNLRSQGNWITAYIELPEGYSASEIDVSTIKLNCAVLVDPDAPTEIGDYDSDGVADMMVKFKKTEVVSNIEEGLCATGWRFANIEFTIKGELCDGTRFTGAYTVKVIKGDANGDGAVDIIDLSMVAMAYGTFSGESHYNPEADINQDSVIDVGDLAMVSIEYGTICP